jgi:hypothetical protein
MKELRFVGTSLADLARFPAEAKRAAEFELWQVQNGLEPSDWKPMNGVGVGVRESGFGSAERGEFSMWRSSPRRSTSCTLSARRHRARRSRISTWQRNDTQR